MAQKIECIGTCPECGKKICIRPTISYSDIAPKVKSGLIPDGALLKYTISTDLMVVYLTEQIHQFSPTAKVEIVPVYCEKKQRKGERHCAYASLKIAISGDEIMKNYENGGWYSKIGEDSESVQLIAPLFNHIVAKYKYDKKVINGWMNYKNLDVLEESFGITEEYLYDIRRFADPMSLKAKDGQTWVIFAADPTLVISDMLKNVETKEVDGIVKIADIRKVNKDLLEYSVYLCPKEMEAYEDPHVRTLLTGETSND